MVPNRMMGPQSPMPSQMNAMGPQGRKAMPHRPPTVSSGF